MLDKLTVSDVGGFAGSYWDQLVSRVLQSLEYN